MMAKRKRKTIDAVDLFCGAGGTSTGLAKACKDLRLKVDLLAVNHWTVAVETHKKNHPWARHLCESVERINPRKVVPRGRLKLLVASPECTNHSIARGGRPINEQSRATAWHVLKWAQELYIDNILIENVREFRDWGPIGANKRPLKSKKGQTYRAFLEALRSLGYRVEERVLNAADYGDATTRERLFIIARRPAHKKIGWPIPSHAKDGNIVKDMFNKRKGWRAAKEVIDWSIESRSIFTRKRPLAKKTLERIAAGLRKFCGPLAEPFLVMMYGTGKGRSVDRPLPTVTAKGQHIGVCESFLVPFYGERKGQKPRTHNVKDPLPTAPASNKFALVSPAFVLQQQSCGAPRSTDKPLPTIAGKGAQAIVQPILVSLGQYGSNGSGVRSTDQPIPTLVSKNNMALVSFIITPGGPNLPKGRSTEAPLPTVTCKDRMAVVEAFVMAVNHGENKGKQKKGRGKSSRTYGIGEPLRTITKQNGYALVEPILMKYNRTGGARSVNAPLDTITTKPRYGLLEPFLTKYNGKSKSHSTREPMRTVDCKDRIALVEPGITRVGLDIRFRMLQPHELAGAMGFPKDYQFAGGKVEQVKQIGNAVCVNLARALCKELLRK